MKLFDISGGKVVVHPEMLALPPFKKYYDNSKDKDHVNDVIRFIILCDYWNSPYVLSMKDASMREAKLKREILKDEHYTLTIDEQICRTEYKELLNTRTLKMLEAMRNKLDTISDWYNNSLEDELDEKKIQMLMAGFEKAKGTYVTIDYLEKAVKAEQLDTMKVRGDNKINPYELA